MDAEWQDQPRKDFSRIARLKEAEGAEDLLAMFIGCLQEAEERIGNDGGLTRADWEGVGRLVEQVSAAIRKRHTALELIEAPDKDKAQGSAIAICQEIKIHGSTPEGLEPSPRHDIRTQQVGEQASG